MHLHAVLSTAESMSGTPRLRESSQSPTFSGALPTKGYFEIKSPRVFRCESMHCNIGGGFHLVNDCNLYLHTVEILVAYNET